MEGQVQCDKEVERKKAMCIRKESDPNNAGSFQKLEKARKQVLPSYLQKGPILPRLF